MNYCILGAGAWGTAIAIHLARNGQSTTLVPRRYEQALQFATARMNDTYLPGHPFPPDLQVAAETKPALLEAEVILLACPIAGLPETTQKLLEALLSAKQAHTTLTLCKGWEPHENLSPAAYIRKKLPAGHHTGVLSGPNNAQEVAAGKPAAILLAHDDENPHTKQIQRTISSPAFRVYTSTDVQGVSLAAALKNIYAIGAGICAGLQLGDNAVAALLTRSLHEMQRLLITLGGDPKTLYGLSGFGDLVATSTGTWSRNRTLGYNIGQGQSAKELLQGQKTVTEGYKTTDTFRKLCIEKHIEAPILGELHAILHEGKPPARALHDLMTRNLTTEHQT
jgi:glycerol-3-phosphate dehydrogenase (NAD(P)+)